MRRRYGAIRAGVRTDSQIGGEEISNAVSISRIEMIPKCIGGSLDQTLSPVTLVRVGSSCARSYRTLRDGFLEGRFSQATISLSLRDEMPGSLC